MDIIKQNIEKLGESLAIIDEVYQDGMIFESDDIETLEIYAGQLLLTTKWLRRCQSK